MGVGTMIVNIRGCNGSGKSAIARAFLATPGTCEIALAPYTTAKGAPRSVMGYEAGDLIVIGPYRTPCGGCDAIPTQALVKESVRLAARRARHVLFEGVIISTLFSGYLTLSEELRTAGQDYLWAYLDTPLAVCLARIQARNGGKTIKEQLVADKVKSIDATRRKAAAAGERVLTLPGDHAVEILREVMG
jgi:hypothetical protein